MSESGRRYEFKVAPNGLQITVRLTGSRRNNLAVGRKFVPKEADGSIDPAKIKEAVEELRGLTGRGPVQTSLDLGGA